jgi:hypothetical protein
MLSLLAKLRRSITTPCCALIMFRRYRSIRTEPVAALQATVEVVRDGIDVGVIEPKVENEKALT